MNQTSRERAVAGIRRTRLLLLPDGREITPDDEAAYAAACERWPILGPLRERVWGQGVAGETPQSIRAMQDLEWAAYEPASDSGHLRHPPKGTLVWELIREWIETEIERRVGAERVRTPLFFDWKEEDIRTEASTFEDNLYFVRTRQGDREFAVRFGGDFGLFRMLRDAGFSYSQLPYRVYESAPSVRYEPHGSLRGLQRVRSCWLFDMHSVCTDVEQGIEEYFAIFDAQASFLREIDFDRVADFTMTEEAFAERKEALVSRLRRHEMPAFVELLSRRKHYWTMKHGFRNADGYKMFNGQLDEINGRTYGIASVGRDGTKHPVVLVHSAWGTVERWMFLALEGATKAAPPSLPLWLCPTQVRFVPVNDSYVEHASDLSEQCRQLRVRADVDDRNQRMGWKLRAAHEEWIPRVVVVGPREVAGGALTVRSRSGDCSSATLTELAHEVGSATRDRPYRELRTLRVSQRPRFR